MKTAPQCICQTKNSLTACAFELFKEFGYSRITISQICNAAHITRTAFYYYFNCKENLLDYYFLYSVVLPDSELDRTSKSASGYSDIFFTLLNKYTDKILAAGRELTRLFLKRHINSADLSPELNAPALYQPLKDMFTNAVESGEIQPYAPIMDMLRCFLHSAAGTLSMWCEQENANFDLYAVLKQNFNIIFRPVQ